MTQNIALRIRDPLADNVIKVATAEVGTTMLEATALAGYDIPTTCGRRGKCRSCSIKVLSGAIPPATVQDTIQLGHDAINERFRLACQTSLVADCEIMMAPPQTETGHQILGAGGSSKLSGGALESGVHKVFIQPETPMDETEHTSDLEKILDSLPDDINQDLSIDILRTLPGLLRSGKGGLTVTTYRKSIVSIEVGDTVGRKFGMAFDIGTTTIVGSLVDLETGEQLAAVGGINPQAPFGGDLMSRISYAQFNPKKLATLRGKILAAINEYINEACQKADVPSEQIYKIVIAGNTCMHHMFLGIDTSYVGLAPYAPVVRQSIVLPARDIPLKSAPHAHICMLPIIAGFVGADTIAAILATGIFNSSKTRVLVDIGTNGEMVMASGGRLVACSAPAGPALEGGQIMHGMRAAVGAIDGAEIDEDIDCHMIGNAPAVGICGSGLIDVAARMLDAGILAPSGRFVKELDNFPDAIAARFTNNESGRGVVLVYADKSGKNEDIVLSQQDIRQLQLAKAAIYSGVLMLQEIMNVADVEIDEVLVAGGFGNFLNMKSATRIRLLPPLPPEKFTYVGNAAHLGAEIALLSETERLRADEIAASIEHIALATRPEFQMLFVDACNFANDDKMDYSRAGA